MRTINLIVGIISLIVGFILLGCGIDSIAHYAYGEWFGPLNRWDYLTTHFWHSFNGILSFIAGFILLMIGVLQTIFLRKL